MLPESVLNRHCGYRRSGSDAAIDCTTGATVFFAGLVAGGRRRRCSRVDHFQVQLDLRSERLSPGDAVHRARLVFGQLSDDDFVRSEPQVSWRPERRPDAHVTLAAGRPSPGSFSVHATCTHVKN